MKPLQPIRHKALDSVDSGDWMPSPKAHGPGFELLGEEERAPRTPFLLPPSSRAPYGEFDFKRACTAAG